MSVAPIITVEKHCMWLGLSDHLRNISKLIFLESDVFNLLSKSSIIVVKANVERLGSENLISELAWSLTNFELGEFSFFNLVFSFDLVRSFCLKPVFSPLVEIEANIFLLCIVSILEGADEVAELRVFPRVLVKVDFETISESFPSH